MENLPVEVIGKILSRLGAAKDVLIASATCRKWREAFRTHLHVLSFNSRDWALYHEIPLVRLEILITQTIFQTTSLQFLSIIMDDCLEFRAAPVVAWLMYTRDTLRSLHYNVRTSPSVNILEKCGRQKLENLILSHNSIIGVEPSYQRFPCLKCLSLTDVSISTMDLSLLLSVCPKIETLHLVNPEIALSDSQATMELTSPTLRNIYVEEVILEKFVLDADKLEVLHLKDSTLEFFELIGKATLKHLKIDDVNVIHFELGENAEHLEVLDVSNFTITGPKFYQMISKSSGLRKLRFWGVVFDDEDDIVDIETIASYFPCLQKLSLCYDLRDDSLHSSIHNSMLISSRMENVVVMELGWTVISDLFTPWVMELLERCPNLKRLIIHGLVSEAKTHEECCTLATFTGSIVRLMRKYTNIDVQFEYE